MSMGDRGERDDAAQPLPSRASLALLAISCVAFSALGVVLPMAYTTALFASYRAALEGSVEGPLNPQTVTLVLGITGGSITGKWLAHLALLPHLARGETWAWRASVAGLLSWFAVDSVVSLAHGAWWNVLFVNSVPLLLVGAPLAYSRRRARCAAPTPPLLSWSPAWWARLVSWVGVATGIGIAFFGTTPLFDVWRTALASAHGASSSFASSEQVVATFFGPIGGATLGQFVMLAALARHRVAVGDVRALDWTLASFLGWFFVDSAWSLSASGGFNVLLVNLPFALASLPALIWGRVRLSRDAAARALAVSATPPSV